MKFSRLFFTVVLITGIAQAQSFLVFQEYKIGYKKNSFKEKILPAIGVALNPDFFRNTDVTLAYANGRFIHNYAIEDRNIENIYIALRYRF